MRRKLQTVSILPVLLLLFTACGKIDDPPPPAVSHEIGTILPQEVVEEVWPDYTVFEGTYRDLVPEAEGEEGYVQISVCRDFLMLEHFLCMDGSVYSFWAEEFWPYEGGFREGEWTSVYGQSQTFSLMTGDGYDTPPRSRSIALTEEGIALTYDFADTEYYIKDDTFSCHETAQTMKQHLGAGEGKEDDALYGKWSYRNGHETIFLEFGKDGALFFMQKEVGRPAQVYRGAFVFEKDHVRIMAEKIGDGQYPYLMQWPYKVDRDGMLWLTFEDGRQMVLMPTDGSITDTMDRQSALTYLKSIYDLSGEYADRYGADYAYSYRLPQFYGDEADVAQVNAQIVADYSPIVEAELAAMAQEEFLSYTDVDWESAVYEGVLYLHIYAESFNWQEHSAYYYDLEQDKFLTTEAVLDRLLIDRGYFLEAVRRDAEKMFVSYFSDIPMEARKEYGYYELLEWTVSEEAVNLDLPIFVDRWGSIAVFARIGSMAGASEFRTVLHPFDGAVG